MKTSLLFAAIATLAVAGCGGSSGGYGDSNGNGGMQPPPPPPAATAFGAFVKEQFAATSDAADAIDVNDREWTFDEDETAFDEVLGK